MDEESFVHALASVIELHWPEAWGCPPPDAMGRWEWSLIVAQDLVGVVTHQLGVEFT